MFTYVAISARKYTNQNAINVSTMSSMYSNTTEDPVYIHNLQVPDLLRVPDRDDCEPDPGERRLSPALRGKAPERAGAQADRPNETRTRTT